MPHSSHGSCAGPSLEFSLEHIASPFPQFVVRFLAQQQTFKPRPWCRDKKIIPLKQMASTASIERLQELLERLQELLERLQELLERLQELLERLQELLERLQELLERLQELLLPLPRGFGTPPTTALRE